MSEEFIEREQARHKKRREKAAKAKADHKRRQQEHANSLRQVKIIVEYEDSVPRCANCLHFQVSSDRLRLKGYDIRVAGKCRQHGFDAVAVGMCNTWKHPLGDTVEQPT